MILAFLGIICSQVIVAQDMIRTHNLDSLLRTIKSPREKVDAILKFLKLPENQHLSDTVTIELAKRALQIAQQASYAAGKVNAMLKLGNCYFRTSDYKRAMEFAQKSKEMAEDLDLEKELADALSLIGKIFTDLDDYDRSSQYFFKGLKLYEKLDDKEGISHALGDIGMVFYDQQDYKKALEYFNNALSIAEKINNPSAIKRQYNNIAVVYGDLQKYDTAILFLRKALAINIKLGDKLRQGTNIMNIGYDQMNLGNFSGALSSFQQSLAIFQELNNHINMAICYINFGFCYRSINRTEESIEYFKLALAEGQKHGFFRTIESGSKMLNQIYAEKKDTLNAYKYVMLEKLAVDSLFASQKHKLLSKLELQYLYEKKEFARQLAQQTKNTVMLIVIFSLLSGLIILGLVFSRHRLKSRLVVFEKEKIESELDMKNRELTVNLISLIKKNEMLSDISSKLVQLDRHAKGVEAKEVITMISQELRNRTDDKMLNEFTLRFQEVHAGFYEKLLQAHPDLSQSDLKLCAFLRLNMSTKDISELNGQQLASIDQARYRLRKKLGLSNSDTNLVTFLSQV
jgi:tetratricopeptide (TPR) repeat protein